VRDARIAVDLDHVRCETAAGDLAISVGHQARERLSPERRAIVTGPRAEWEVPWGDDGSGAHVAAATVEADSLSARTLGMSVTWAPVCLVRSGRLHRCGSARLR
jgi:hypothetical protein